MTELEHMRAYGDYLASQMEDDDDRSKCRAVQCSAVQCSAVCTSAGASAVKGLLLLYTQ
jgi:hypothetical protein